MVKVVTPVQYESPLGGLNEVRPMEMSGEVKPFIDTSILNINPIDNVRPAKGRLLRCGNDSAVLQNSIKGFRKVETVFAELGYGDDEIVVTFSQRVERVLWSIIVSVNCQAIIRCNDKYWLPIQYVSLTGTTLLTFANTALYFIGAHTAGGHTEANLYGFYN